MKKILYLALPTLLAASCGDSADPLREWPMDAAPDGSEVDTAPSVPDVPLRLDIAPTPDAPIDVPSAVEHPGPALDAPAAKLDAPERPDMGVYWDVRYAQPVDGPAGPTDANTRTLYSPDGRTWTVIMVAACQSGSQADTTSCPATYDEGLAKVLGIDGGRSFPETRAGRCSEGSYVYSPYFGTSSTACYYDASGQRLVASALHSDTIIECGDGTASHTIARGAYPPCTNITWEAYNHL